MVDKAVANPESILTLEEAIVNTVREPLLVLDGSLCVVMASRSFYSIFNVTPSETLGRHLYDLGDGQWNIPGLRKLLDEIVPQHTTIEEYEVEHDFPSIGPRTMLLNARKVLNEGNNNARVLLALEDVTVRRKLERDKDELLRQKDLLFREMNHRVHNSLQIIASILLMKARAVESEDTRRHLQDAHARVMAVATIQGQLHPSLSGEEIEAGAYLKKLCESLAASMIPEPRKVTLTVQADEGVTTSEQAVSMGLITTELVINSLKHAFLGDGEGTIIVVFESSVGAWRISVSDDGIGIGRPLSETPAKLGLGTTIVEALVRQLGGRVTTSDTSPGTSVSVTVPRAA